MNLLRKTEETEQGLHYLASLTELTAKRSKRKANKGKTHTNVLPTSLKPMYYLKTHPDL